MGLSLDIPFRIDGAGRVASTTDPNRQLELRLRNLIATAPAERVMRNDYGTGVGSMIFDVNDSMHISSLVTTIRDNIRVWEPDVLLDDIEVVSQDPAGGMVELVIVYHLPGQGTSRQFTVAVGSTASYGWPEGG